MKNTLCALFASTAVSFAAVYYVNNQTGDDKFGGLSPDKAFKTLSKAVSALKPGDTLEIAPGRIYYETLAFASSGTPDKPITVNGNGAIVSGRGNVPADNWQELGDSLYLNANNAQYGALRPRVLNEKEEIISVNIGRAPEKLKPGEAVWNKKGIYLRLKDGQKPQELTLYGFYRESGVKYDSHSYITVNNLISENNANDGFNIHGYCRGLKFNNITARWNGDDGFSMHEDVIATVHGAHLHHNDYGIQDVGISRSFFFGVLSEDNREIGADLFGGMRSMEDCVIRNNGSHQIRISGGDQPYGFPNSSPLATCHAFLKNVLVTGGNGAALNVCKNAAATVESCSFLNCHVGVDVQAGGTLALFSCAVAGNRDFAYRNGGRLISTANAFFPPKAQNGTAQLAGKDILAAIQDTTSAIEKPYFRDAYAACLPVIVYGKNSASPGFKSMLDLPFVPQTPAEFAAANVPQHFEYTFESQNILSRLYLEPAIKGATSSVDFSSDQAASPAHSIKVAFSAPAGTQQKSVLVKLFSVPVRNVNSPLKMLSFKMFGQNQNIVCKPRIRDAKGKSHYGPDVKMTWNGWKTITWDMTKQADADKMPLQTMEVVFDFRIPIPETGASFTTYIDDLVFE